MLRLAYTYERHAAMPPALYVFPLPSKAEIMYKLEVNVKS